MVTGTPAPERAHAAWVLPLAVFLIALAVYVPTVAKDFVNTDPAANSLTAWRIAQTGQPWMEGLDLREAGKVPHYARSHNGHMVTTRTPGQIWAAVPFYLGSTDSQTAFGFMRGGVAAATLSAGAVALLFLALRRHVPDLAALGASAVVAFATPVWSVSANALWTHPVTLFGLAGAAWGAMTRRWWACGLFFGVGMLARPHIALIAAAVGLGMAWSRRSPRVAVGVGVPSLLSLGVIAAWNRYVFGVWDLRSGYGQSYELVVPGASKGLLGMLENLAGFLISPARGFLVWTPLALVLLPAVIRCWRSAPHWARWFAVGGTLYSVAQLGLNVFHGGDGFYGYRLALELLICVTPLYVFSVSRAGTVARAMAPLFVGLQLAAISLGSVIEGFYIPFARVWTDNSLWLGLRTWPLIVGPVVVLLTVLGALATHSIVNSLSRSVPPEREAGNQPPMAGRTLRRSRQ